MDTVDRPCCSFVQSNPLKLLSPLRAFSGTPDLSFSGTFFVSPDTCHRTHKTGKRRGPT